MSNVLTCFNERSYKAIFEVLPHVTVTVRDLLKIISRENV